jgi:hypothetical protein
MGKRRGTVNRKSTDPRVPILGDRVRLVLRVVGLSEKQAARALAEERWATITQPALNNICNGKTRTCRRSVRDGLARVGGGAGITSEWLGGEGPLGSPSLNSDGSLTEGGAETRASSLRVLALILELERAWHRDNPRETFPREELTKAVLRLLDPILLWPTLIQPESVGPNPPALGLLNEDQREAYTAAAYEAIHILLGPWLSDKGPANWRAIRGTAAWLEHLLLTADTHRTTARLRAELNEALQHAKGRAKQDSPDRIV